MLRIRPVCPLDCGWKGTLIEEGETAISFANPLGEGRVSEQTAHLIWEHYDPAASEQPWHGMFVKYEVVV